MCLLLVQLLSRVRLYDLMDCSTAGSSALRYLLEFAQIHYFQKKFVLWSTSIWKLPVFILILTPWSHRVRPDWRDLPWMHCIICEKSQSLSTLFFDLLNIWNALDSGSTVWKAFIWITKIIFPRVIVCTCLYIHVHVYMTYSISCTVLSSIPRTAFLLPFSLTI